MSFLPMFLRNFVFTQLVKFVNPYSRTIPFKVECYEKGLCMLQMKEQRSIRNPFQSVHAAALVLLGETAGGLSLTSALSPKERFIVKSINATYYLKSRNTILATAKVDTSKLEAIRLKKGKGSIVMDVDIHQHTGKEKLATIEVDFFVDCTKI